MYGGVRGRKTKVRRITTSFSSYFDYGASYNKGNLNYAKRFYILSMTEVNTCVHNLSWSHIRRILSAFSDPNARLWYLKTADKDMWSFRALDRNISTQYYERRLAAQREKSALPSRYGKLQTDPLEYIKNPR